MPGDEEKLLIEALRDYKTDFVSTGYSTMGFLLLVVGWLLTSSSAREYIRSHASISIIGIVLIISSFIGYLIGATMVLDTSERIADALSQADTTEIVYRHYQLTWQSVVLFGSIQALPTFLICWLLGMLALHPKVGNTEAEAEQGAAANP